MVTTRRRRVSGKDDTPTPEPSEKKGSSATGKAGVAGGEAASGGVDVVTTPRTTHIEFGGPVGATGIMIALPLVVYGLYFFCGPWGYLSVSLSPLGLTGWEAPASAMGEYFGTPSRLFSWEATGVFCAWMLFQAGLYAVLPGKDQEGVLLRNGERLTYRLNGFCAFVVTMVLVAVAAYTRWLPLEFIYDQFVELTTASILVSYALSVYLYVSSFGDGGRKLLALGGNTGNPLYDFFIGRELNPRLWGWFDLKYFCELRPGLIGWIVIDVAMMCKQYEQLGYVSNALAMVTAFQFIYVLDSLWHESAILSTMDITTDGFGFMLAFGDLSWVPFTYSLQARFLCHWPIDLPMYLVLAIITIKCAGYAIFRGANSQKNAFRTTPDHPSVVDLPYIQTERGTRLLIAGWWGIARHINYFGDWLMAWAWCLPTGFHTPITYYYVIYFAILLVHRDLRDGHKCQTKYGKDWDTYCHIVRYRIVPYLY